MTHTGNNKTTVGADNHGVQTTQNGTANTDASISPSSSLLKGLARASSNGSNYRTITPNRPNIYTPFTNPKKGNGSHKIKGIFAGKKDYHYNDHLTAAFVELAARSRKAKQPLIAVTCTFNDATHIELKEARRIIEKFKRLLTGEAAERTKSTRWNVDSILVIEECDKSPVKMPSGNEEKRLHAHIITYGNISEQKRLEAILKPFSKQTMIQDTWTNKRPYNDCDESDEDQFGDMPTDAPDPTNDYWLNSYKTKDKQGNTWVHTIHPVCLRGVDYITKGLNKQIGNGRNFTLIGLKNAPKRRLVLFKQGQALGKPTKDWS